MEAAVEDNLKDSTENVQPENNATEKTPSPPPQELSKKSKKDDKQVKINDKSVEQMLKSLETAPLEEKRQFCKRYIQAGEENKKMQFYIKQADKRYTLLMKSKDQLQLEYNKTVLLKSKLENLCRELQKQNKAIKEESLLKIREEEERRKETQAKFQNTLSEITTLLQQNNEKNAKLRDDNISMSEKFKSVVQQYQLREQQVDKMAKQMSLESQLSEAKLQKAGLEHQAEKERLMADMEQMKVTLDQYRAKVMELQGNETGLRGQLAVYTDKYDEFQNALVKSNQVFGGFKEQMEKMSKKIKKLEKESLSWKQRWETSQTALLDMCSERQAGENRTAAATRQLAHMQSLCRTLQAERGVLLSTLKEHGIERPPLPTPPPAPAPAPVPAPTPASNAKVDAMAANCVQLRQSLAHLQSQLNVLTNKQTPEEPPKPEKQKKNKSKKNKKSQDKVDTHKEDSDDAKDDENQPGEDTVQNDLPEKVDEKTLENLIQAINNANINLCDLEVSTEKNELEDTGDIVEEVLKELESPTKVTTDVIKSEVESVEPPKIVEVTNKVTEASNEISNKTTEIKEVSNEKEKVNTEAVNKANRVAKKAGVPAAQEVSTKDPVEVQETSKKAEGKVIVPDIPNEDPVVEQETTKKAAEPVVAHEMPSEGPVSEQDISSKAPVVNQKVSKKGKGPVVVQETLKKPEGSVVAQDTSNEDLVVTKDASSKSPGASKKTKAPVSAKNVSKKAAGAVVQEISSVVPVVEHDVSSKSPVVQKGSKKGKGPVADVSKKAEGPVITSSSNDEVAHIEEVKPILNEA